LNHTYALSGSDISVLSIEGQSGPNLPLWIFMTQSACDHSAPGPVPFRNAFGRIMGRTTRAGRFSTGSARALCSLFRQNRIPGEVAKQQTKAPKLPPNDGAAPSSSIEIIERFFALGVLR
jgi:hypothetical protein